MTQSADRPRALQTFKQAIQLAKRAYSPLLLISIVSSILIGLSAMDLELRPIPQHFLSISLLIAVILAIVGIFPIVLSFIFIASLHHHGNRCSWRFALKYCGRLFGRVLIGSIIIAIIVSIGFLLLIIPGIILGTFLSIYLPILLFESKKSIGEAFKESFRRVKPYFWFTLRTILLGFAVFHLITLLIKAIFYLAGISLLVHVPYTPVPLSIFIPIVCHLFLSPFYLSIFMAIYFELTKQAKRKRME